MDTKDSFQRSLLLVWQICSLNWDLWINSFVGTLCIWLWLSNVKILRTVTGVLGSNPVCEFQYFFMLTSLVQIWFIQFLLGLHMWNLEVSYGYFLLESCNTNLNQTGSFPGYIFPKAFILSREPQPTDWFQARSLTIRILLIVTLTLYTDQSLNYLTVQAISSLLQSSESSLL